MRREGAADAVHPPRDASVDTHGTRRLDVERIVIEKQDLACRAVVMLHDLFEGIPVGFKQAGSKGQNGGRFRILRALTTEDLAG